MRGFYGNLNCMRNAYSLEFIIKTAYFTILSNLTALSQNRVSKSYYNVIYLTLQI